MSEKNTGGPAFPVAADGAYIPDCELPENPPAREFPGHPGMSLRDWFAGQALISIIRACSAGQHDAGAVHLPDPDAAIERKIAADAYALADAMIAEREK